MRHLFAFVLLLYAHVNFAMFTVFPTLKNGICAQAGMRAFSQSVYSQFPNLLDRFPSEDRRYMQQRAEYYRQLFIKDQTRQKWGKQGTYTIWGALNLIKNNVDEEVIKFLDVSFLSKSLPLRYQLDFGRGTLSLEILKLALDFAKYKKIGKEMDMAECNKEHLQTVDELGLRTDYAHVPKKALDNAKKTCDYVKEYIEMFKQELLETQKKDRL
ncbi:MAG: hypothetical protein WD055_01200 [Candidatus Dependentiae bacterium]